MAAVRVSVALWLCIVALHASSGAISQGIDDGRAGVPASSGEYSSSSHSATMRGRSRSSIAATGRDLFGYTTSMQFPGMARPSPAPYAQSTALNNTIVINTTALASTVSPLTIYAKSFRTLISEAPRQEIVAVGAMVIGAVCLWDGPYLWHAIFTGVLAAAGAFVAYQEGKALGLTSNAFSEVFLALEVGGVVGYATHCGFEGTQVLLGASLGALGAWGTSAAVHSFDIPGILLIWYSAGAILGLLVYHQLRQPVLATFAPLVGGVFVASGTGLLLSRAVALVSSGDRRDGAAVWFPPHDASWINVVESLIGTGGGGITLAALCGCALVGAVAQSMSGQRAIAIFMICGGIAFSTMSAFACEMLDKGSRFTCPPFLASSTSAAWQWLVVGSLLWATITGVSAYSQLGRSDYNARSTYLQMPESSSKRRAKDNSTVFVEAAPPQTAFAGIPSTGFVTQIPPQYR